MAKDLQKAEVREVAAEDTGEPTQHFACCARVDR